MTRLLCILLTLLFSVSGPATGANSDFWQSSLAANSAVKPGQAGTYGELKEQKKAFGETEPLDMDHRPSYAAQVKAAEAAKGAPLSKAELAKLKANTQAVATPRADHQTKSRTYGGRNTDARSTADAADLDAAKAADDAAYR